MHLLMAADTAREFTKSIGIIQAQDAVIMSPNQTEKDKMKDLEGVVS